jgi:hypothetical protein
MTSKACTAAVCLFASTTCQYFYKFLIISGIRNKICFIKFCLTSVRPFVALPTQNAPDLKGEGYTVKKVKLSL